MTDAPKVKTVINADYDRFDLSRAALKLEALAFKIVKATDRPE